jgi:hypothetical protein
MRVHDFRDIPLLFTEGEDKMGAPKKTRAELLNKIVQFIWDYQQKHNGETPALGVIGTHVGVKAEGMGYYAAILVDEGRIDRIGVRPFRVSITDHKENKRAITSYQRLLAKKEQHEAEERDRIRERQGEERVAEQRTSDRETVLAAASDTVVDDRPPPSKAPETRTFDRPAIAGAWERQTGTGPQQDPDALKVERFNDAQARVREVNREVKALMPKLLKIADERDLVFELISRGYTVKR